MRKALRVAFSVVTILLVAAVAMQMYLAGVGVFSDPEDELFAIHGWNGRIVLPALILLTVILAAVSKAGRSTIWLAVLLVGLLFLQGLIFIVTGLIFNIGPDHANPPLGATLLVSLHPLNGLLILWFSFVVAKRAYRRAFRPEAVDAAAVAAAAEPVSAAPQVTQPSSGDAVGAPSR